MRRSIPLSSRYLFYLHIDWFYSYPTLLLHAVEIPLTASARILTQFSAKAESPGTLGKRGIARSLNLVKFDSIAVCRTWETFNHCKLTVRVDLWHHRSIVT